MKLHNFKLFCLIIVFICCYNNLFSSIEIHLKDEVNTDKSFIILSDIAVIKKTKNNNADWANIKIAAIKNNETRRILRYHNIRSIIQKNTSIPFYLIGTDVVVNVPFSSINSMAVKKRIKRYVNDLFGDKQIKIKILSEIKDLKFRGTNFKITIQKNSFNKNNGILKLKVVINGFNKIFSFIVDCKIVFFKTYLIAVKDLKKGMYPGSKDFITKTDHALQVPDNSIRNFKMIKGRRLKDDIISKNIVLESNFEPKLVVKYGQKVDLLFYNCGISITAPAKALESGRIGQRIQFSNILTGKRVYAIVNKDGNAEMRQNTN